MDSKKTKQDEAPKPTNHDVISDLPEDIKIDILLSLPIEEAVRTCLLSRKWSSTWTHLPSLKFDDRSYISRYGLIEGTERFRNLVDGVLCRHEGSILKFILICKRYEPSALDRWIETLQRLQVEFLHFQSNTGARFRVPLQFFSCRRFRWVQLKNCIVRPPRTCSFQFLQNLVLVSCTIETSELQNLISSCVLLMSLQLSLCQGGTDCCLNIYSKRLRWLHVVGSFFHIHLWTPCLTEARLLLFDHRLDIRAFKRRKCTVSLAMALGSVPFIQSLWISQAYLLTPISRFHQNLLYLKELGLFADFDDAWETRGVIFLIKHCPFLDRLFITNSNKLQRMADGPINWEEATQHLSLQSLRTLYIEYFKRGSLSNLVLHALRTAPFLKEVTFKNPLDILTLEELHEYQWASQNCRVLINQHTFSQAPSYPL